MGVVSIIICRCAGNIILLTVSAELFKFKSDKLHALKSNLKQSLYVKNAMYVSQVARYKQTERQMWAV